jgi:hypothetical protein
MPCADCAAVRVFDDMRFLSVKLFFPLFFRVRLIQSQSAGPEVVFHFQRAPRLYCRQARRERCS